MNTNPVMYTAEQMEDLGAFISDRFGDYTGVMHELESRYVHTDVAVVTAPEETSFVTFGISARPMTAPLKELERCELVLYASPSLDAASREGRILGAELTSLGRLPFENDTWFGEGHTVTATDSFRKAFGYDAFLLLYTGETYETVTDRVRFLALLPLYEEERQLIIKHGAARFLSALFDEADDRAFHADVRRAAITQLPDAPAPTPQELCGVDDDLFDDFLAFIKETEEAGLTVTEDDIARWVDEHRPQ